MTLRLVPRKPTSPYQRDINRIVSVCQDRGYVISPEDAQTVWETYSESMAAGWMGLPDTNTELFTIVLQYSEEGDDE